MKKDFNPLGVWFHGLLLASLVGGAVAAHAQVVPFSAADLNATHVVNSAVRAATHASGPGSSMSQVGLQQLSGGVISTNAHVAATLDTGRADAGGTVDTLVNAAFARNVSVGNASGTADANGGMDANATTASAYGTPDVTPVWGAVTGIANSAVATEIHALNNGEALSQGRSLASFTGTSEAFNPMDCATVPTTSTRDPSGVQTGSSSSHAASGSVVGPFVDGRAAVTPTVMPPVIFCGGGGGGNN